LVVLIGGALSVLIGGLVLAGVILHYGAQDRARPAAVIVVLGGGESGTARRAQHAAALYHQGYAGRVLCTGGRTVGATPEARRCAITLAAHGVPPEAIRLELASRSTEENAIQAARIMRAQGWDDAVLVTDDFHLWRAVWLFEHEGVMVWPSPAQSNLAPRERALAVAREVAAIGWQLGKSALGLPYTHVN